MTKTMTSVTQELLSISSARDIVDKTLDVFFAERIAKSNGINRHYGELWQSINRLSGAGGKRIRSYATLMSYQIFSDKPFTDVVPIAAAQELLHLALLIHDDIIDRDYIRYGVDNISGQYNHLYQSMIGDADERRHFSDSAAILAGDLLISGGYQLIHASTLPARDIAAASTIFSNAVFTVAGGELLDTESSFRPFDAIDSLTIARYKTAHYSFVTPILMGACLAGVNEEVQQSLEQFGETIGIAYQLVDDYLGVFGDEDLTGKSNINDIQEAKRTYLIEQFRLIASPEQMQIFDSLFGKKHITQVEAEAFRDIMTTSGAKDAMQAAIDGYHTHALQLLQTMPISVNGRTAFEALVERVIRRER